jgi:subtilisin family serine protease
MPAAPVRDYVNGEVLVGFRAPQTLVTAQQLAQVHSLALAKHFPWLSSRQGCFICLLRSPARSTVEILAELRSEPAVAYVEPNHLRWTHDLRVPNDARFGELWGLQNTGQLVNGFPGVPGADIRFLTGWGLARFSTDEVVVAVIDTGVDYTHPDLAGNMWTNPGEIPRNNLDDDGNGYVDDVHGYDFAGGTGDPMDSGFHGTHVSGTIAAVGNNELGVIGVDFQAHIMALKVSSDGSTLLDSAIIEAIQYAAMMKTRGVNVAAINASFGGGSSNHTEYAAIQAAGAEGIVFCAAAGNSAANNDISPTYPAAYRLPNMLVVAASDQSNALASFSDYGPSTVDMAAPGVNILSCVPVSASNTTASVTTPLNDYNANPLTYAGLTGASGLSGALYYCGLGYPTNFPLAVRGNVALCERGTLYFSDKVSNAMAAGARAVIIFNNVTGNFTGTLGSAGGWIPAVTISQADGQALTNSLPPSATVFNVLDPSALYELLDGTSMAAPHVSGAIAFAAMNFPAETVSQRVQRLRLSVTSVPALQGKVLSGGVLNLARVVDSDANGLPDWWEQLYFGHLTGTDPNADPDGDGASNLAEWRAGTDPTSPLSCLRLHAVLSAGTTNLTLQWPSASGRFYRLLRSTNLVVGFDSIVRTNISATPPLNSELDTNAPPGRPCFYRLELEP